MAATGQSIVTASLSAPARRGPVASALAPIARRAMPLVTASAGVALATLAAERALAGIALRTAERTGLARPESPKPVDGVMRVTITRTTVVERITRLG